VGMQLKIEIVWERIFFESHVFGACGL
jgi:hypothetical protein